MDCMGGDVQREAVKPWRGERTRQSRSASTTSNNLTQPASKKKKPTTGNTIGVVMVEVIVMRSTETVIGAELACFLLGAWWLAAPPLPLSPRWASVLWLRLTSERCVVCADLAVLAYHTYV